MAELIGWEYIFPAVKIAFKSGCEFQIEAIMDNTLKLRPQLPGAGVAPAAQLSMADHGALPILL
jgi:hypothetical protein